tara:strand:- start:183 stop:461 length:279 start_codon:yes stop_codon:yes gene_type:complete
VHFFAGAFFFGAAFFFGGAFFGCCNFGTALTVFDLGGTTARFKFVRPDFSKLASLPERDLTARPLPLLWWPRPPYESDLIGMSTIKIKYSSI